MENIEKVEPLWIENSNGKTRNFGTIFTYWDFRYKIMRNLNANIVFVVKCFKKAPNTLMGSIIYIFKIWGRMTKYEEVFNIVSHLSAGQRRAGKEGDLPQCEGDTERLPIHEPTSQYCRLVLVVCCPLSSGGHRSHCPTRSSLPWGLQLTCCRPWDLNWPSHCMNSPPANLYNNLI